MDGREFRRRLLDDAALASIPLVVVSADIWASRLAGAQGIRAVLIKPVAFDDLLRSIEESCTR
jgi:CheY-like chemotaxis protein